MHRARTKCVLGAQRRGFLARIVVVRSRHEGCIHHGRLEESLDHSTAVSDIWRHHDLSDARADYRRLVRYATLAASSHNTQPWKFQLEPGRISILPDLSRRCPQVDPDDHHLYGSLGCALENLLLASHAAGLEGHYTFDEAGSRLQVDLEQETPSLSALFDAIPSRQSTRAEYDGASISSEQQRLLEQAAVGNGVAALALSSSAHKEQVAEYVAAGNKAQFADPGWAAEMKTWIRFNSREAVQTGDGLYGQTLGIPEIPRFLGKLLMGVATSARRQNRTDVTNIRSSALLVVLSSDANDKRHWIEAGRCYERLALQAAALGLRTAFINQPVEVPLLRQQFAAALGLGDRRPDLVIRIGRGPDMPRSLRRPLDQVIL